MITIRKLKTSDLNCILATVNLPDYLKLFGFKKEFSRKAVLRRIESQEFDKHIEMFVITRRYRQSFLPHAYEEMIGLVGIRSITKHHRGTLFLYIRPEHRGKNYARQAINQLFYKVFEGAQSPLYPWRVFTVEIYVGEDNCAMEKIARSIPARLVGYVPDRFYLGCDNPRKEDRYKGAYLYTVNAMDYLCGGGQR